MPGKQSFYRLYGCIAAPGKSYDYIIILGHMRSGSSLLVHLLNSNPEICGYGETHTRYSSPKDFDALKGNVLFNFKKFAPPTEVKFLMDKLLHDYTLKPEKADLLIHERIRLLFLLRQPKDTINSIIKNISLFDDKEKAVGHYVNRLASMEKFAHRLSPYKKCFALTYEQIIDQTNQLFAMLEEFLDLKTPLSDHYDILPTTGKKGVGDHSSNILTGSIIRNKQTTADPQISPESMAQAAAAYESCIALLSQRCVRLDPEEH